MARSAPMPQTSVMYAARPDGKWAVLDRGPPTRAVVADRTTLVDVLTEITKTNAEAMPESLGPGLGMGTAEMSRTTADRLFSMLRRAGALEVR